LKARARHHPIGGGKGRQTAQLTKMDEKIVDGMDVTIIGYHRVPKPDGNGRRPTLFSTETFALADRSDTGKRRLSQTHNMARRRDPWATITPTKKAHLPAAPAQ